jgi:hypothetical protein
MPQPCDGQKDSDNTLSSIMFGHVVMISGQGQFSAVQVEQYKLSSYLRDLLDQMDECFLLPVPCAYLTNRWA